MDFVCMEKPLNGIEILWFKSRKINCITIGVHEANLIVFLIIKKIRKTGNCTGVQGHVLSLAKNKQKTSRQKRFYVLNETRRWNECRGCGCSIGVTGFSCFLLIKSSINRLLKLKLLTIECT